MFGKKKNIYGEYPCSDYINNALRFLLESDDPHHLLIANAIGELCYCISKANGYYHDDVARKLAETGLCPYTIVN